MIGGGTLSGCTCQLIIEFLDNFYQFSEHFNKVILAYPMNQVCSTITLFLPRKIIIIGKLFAISVENYNLYKNCCTE